MSFKDPHVAFEVKKKKSTEMHIHTHTKKTDLHT